MSDSKVLLISKATSSQTETLLAGILQAFKIEPDEVQFYENSVNFKNAVFQIQPRLILIFGFTLANELLGYSIEGSSKEPLDYAGFPMIITYALEELISNPVLKKHAYHTLQKINSLEK